MQVVADKLLVNYEINGKGKTVLLLHGWGDSMAGLESFAKQIGSKYRVIQIDLPGFGSSQAPSKVWGLDNYANFIAAFLHKINEGDIYAIIGHSNGGAIAIRGVSSNILKTEKLILLASAGIRSEYRGKVKVIRLITKAGKALTMPLPKSTKQTLRKYVYKTVGSDMLVAEHLQETFKKVVTDDVQSDARKIKLPTLLLYGDQDTATPMQYGQLFHELMSNSTLEIIEGASHFLYQEKPQEVTMLVSKFLS